MLYVVGNELQVDPIRTRSFLLAHPGVFGAQVELHKGRMIAYVTVAEETTITKRRLQEACKAALGIEHMPNEIMLVKGRTTARTA